VAIGEFTVGAIFDVDLAGSVGQLERLSGLFDTAAASARALGTEINTLGKGENIFGGIMGGLRDLAAEFGVVTAAATGFGDAMAASMARATSAARDAVAGMASIAAGMGGGGGGFRGGGILPNPEDDPLLRGGPLRLTGPGASVGGGGGGAGGGGPGLSISPMGGGIGAGGGRHAGMREFITGEALYEAMHSNASEESAIAGALVRMHMDPRSPEGIEQAARMKKIAHDAAQGTSFSETEVARGLAIIGPGMALTGPGGVTQLGNIFEEPAKAAEAAKQLNIGSFEGTLLASLQVAHMLRAYKPEELHGPLNLLGAVTESVPGSTMESEAKSMSYILPAGRALGVPTEQLIAATGFLQRAGLEGTVGATTLRQMLVGLDREGGPMGAQVTAAKRDLEKSLALEPGMLSGGKESAHEKALRTLHLHDAKGNSLVSTDGHTDLDKLFTALAKDRASMSADEFGRLQYSAFGIRGQQGGEIISEGCRNIKTTSIT
jgi:hypothetical protein